MAKNKNIRRYLFLLLWAAAFAVSFWSCNSGGNGAPAAPDRIIIAYLASDNDLSTTAYNKVKGLTSGFEGMSGTTGSGGLAGSGTKLYIFHDPADSEPYLTEMTNDGTYTTVFDEMNSADGATLGRVCRNVMGENPGAVFGLVFFSHSTGWLPHGTFERPTRSFPFDIVSGGEQGTRSVAVDRDKGMELDELAAAIPDGAFSFIIFESCYSAGIEVAYQLRKKADYLAVSAAEILDPGFTYVYETALPTLYRFDGPPVDFMEAAFGYFDGSPSWMRSATFSIISTRGLDALAAFLRGKVTYSPLLPPGEWQYFDRNIDKATGIRLVYDLYDYFAGSLTENEAIQFRRLLEECVIHSNATSSFLGGESRYDGFEIQNHSGLTVFAPQPSIPVLNESYTRTQWFKAVFQ